MEIDHTYKRPAVALVRTRIGTLRSDDGGCLRRRAEVENICLRISGSRRVRFPAVAVLSVT